MSRAFVKETDGDALADDPLPRPPRQQPCYMTLSGITALKRELDALKEKLAEGTPDSADLSERAALQLTRQRIRELNAILQGAVAVDVSRQSTTEIRFGARVELRDQHGVTHHYQIVGEDEVVPGSGRISWISPLGRELIGLATGDTLTWQRGRQPLTLEVIGFEYA